MKKISRIFIAVVAVILSGCSDSSDNVEVTTTLDSTLVLSGEVPLDAPIIPGQVTVISSAAQLAQVASGRCTVPPSLATYDFSTGDVVYVEALGDQDPFSTVRVSRINRTNREELVYGEVCSSTGRVPGTHRPYALYTTPKFMSFSSYTLATVLTADCATVKRIAATFVGGSGRILLGVDLPPQVIRNAADLQKLKDFAGNSLPAQYQSVDFSTTNLLFLRESQSTVEGDYLRLMEFVLELDGSRTAVVEYCGTDQYLGHYPWVEYSIYAVPSFTGDYRQVALYRPKANPQVCVTTP